MSIQKICGGSGSIQTSFLVAWLFLLPFFIIFFDSTSHMCPNFHIFNFSCWYVLFDVALKVFGIISSCQQVVVCLWFFHLHTFGKKLKVLVKAKVFFRMFTKPHSSFFLWCTSLLLLPLSVIFKFKFSIDSCFPWSCNCDIF